MKSPSIQSNSSPVSTEWDGLNIYVMGLGRFGGGVGVTKYLSAQGASVLVGDSANRDSLQTSIQALGNEIESGTVRLSIGPHDECDLQGMDVLVVNPAVPKPWSNQFIIHAKQQGIRITTEIEIAYRLLNPANIIAVTGSAGKSTTCAMIHHALESLGRSSILGGNIGGSLLDQAHAMSDQTSIVLELSSAMLHWLGESNAFEDSPPRVGCITNWTPNHLDWHGDIHHYKSSKQVLAQFAQHLVVGEGVADWGDGVVVRHKDIVPSCTIPGRHNGLNAAMAVESILQLLNVQSRDSVVQAVQSFAGLPHRLQMVHEVKGIRFYNDSKCTVPEATLLAIDAIADIAKKSKIHLIAGGYDKGSDLRSIASLTPELAGLYCIGATGSRLELSAAHQNAMNCDHLESAMSLIFERIKDGDIVLLSPGCASWDQFANYEKRGERFAEIAQSLSRRLK